MTWLIGIRSDTDKYQPSLAPKPGCRTYEEIIELNRPLHKAAREYRQAHGFLPLGVYADGNMIEDRFWPREGYFIKDVKVLPPLLGLSSFYLVKESWRDALEGFEPGLHQFKPIPLFYKDGSPVEERYHALNILTALRDVSDRERSTASFKVYEDGRWYFVKTSENPYQTIYFKRRLVDGFHLWCPLDTIIFNIAVSSSLFDQLSTSADMKMVKKLWVEDV